MAYLLDVLIPGLGHLAARRWVLGVVLLAAWFSGLFVGALALSFDTRALLPLVAVHPVLACFAVVRLFWLNRRERLTRRPWRWSLALVPLVAVVLTGSGLVFSSAVVRPVLIRSGSMSPSVVTGDVVLVQMFGPLLNGVHLGDIVLVMHPQHRGRLLIKRIIGLAGDLIQIRGGELMRNGRRLSECELRSLRDHETHQPVIERLEVLGHRPYLVWDRPAVRSRAIDVRVQPGHLFVVGDNRDRSGDSRTFGTVPVENVRGLVTVRIAPVLTNRVYQAPLGARRSAYERCSSRGRASRTADGG